MNKKGLVISFIASLLIVGVVFVWSLFYNWGVRYFTNNFSFTGMILPFIIAFVFFFFVIRFIVFAITRTIYLRKGAKDGKHIDMTVVDGMPNIPQGMVVTLSLEMAELLIKSQVTGATARLPYTQIKNVGHLTTEEVRERNKSVIGRAVVGGLLLGSVGAIVGGMSGIGTKTDTERHEFLIINYTSQQSEEKVLSFSINYNITWGLAKFTGNLKTLAGIAPEPAVYVAPPKDITL